MNINKRFYCS